MKNKIEIRTQGGKIYKMTTKINENNKKIGSMLSFKLHD